MNDLENLGFTVEIPLEDFQYISYRFYQMNCLGNFGMTKELDLNRCPEDGAY
ncbi:hypothetical protein [Thalassotalea marina]|uniref:Uncharacterized protein n=1 Tax=Thalassotalea marina TaxID=1673741 RepID=A0A919BDE8_9GAMM|nr:hypothetical protein [Thalassotalea marina]GHF84850.1 hypothetical protein GCM10017161_10410 [Thalassotalea marina]